MGREWTKRTVNVSQRYTEEDLAAIGVEIIRYIRERTLDGKGPGNKSWSGRAGSYSKAYKESLNFRIGRKSGTVNLKLSGDMLEEMGVLEIQKGKIRYGIDSGSPEAGKAEGNIRGTYGQSSPISGKARDFLKLEDKEIESILAQFPLKDIEERQKATTRVLKSKEAAKTLSPVVSLDEDEDFGIL